MPYKALTEDTAREWEAFCRAHYVEYKKKCPPPFIAFFWSASAFIDSYQNWQEEYDKYFHEDGNKYWEEYGYYVVNWNVPSSQPIVVRPITERQAA